MPQISSCSHVVVSILAAAASIALAACSHGRIGIVSAEYASPACSKSPALPAELHDARWDAVLRPSEIEQECPGLRVYEVRRPDVMRGPQTAGFVFIQKPEPPTCRWVISTHYPSSECGDASSATCTTAIREAKERLNTFANKLAETEGKRVVAGTPEAKILPSRDPVSAWCKKANTPQN